MLMKGSVQTKNLNHLRLRQVCICAMNFAFCLSLPSISCLLFGVSIGCNVTRPLTPIPMIELDVPPKLKRKSQPSKKPAAKKPKKELKPKKPEKIVVPATEEPTSETESLLSLDEEGAGGGYLSQNY